MRTPHVYLAAGWFNPEQKKQMVEVYSVLSKLRDQGEIKLFAPFYDGIVLKPNDPDLQAKMKEVWSLDIGKIEISDLVVACTQGHDVGTIFECGYASALKRTIIGYNSQPEYGLNVMLAQGAKVFVKTEKDLQKAVEDFCVVFYKGEDK